MRCERCHQEAASFKPFSYAPWGRKRRVGYLKFCSACYWRKKLSDTGIVLGMIAVVLLFVYAIMWAGMIGFHTIHADGRTLFVADMMRFGGWSGFIYGTIILGVRIGLIIVALRLLLFAKGLMGSRGIARWIETTKTFSPGGYSHIDARDKRRSFLSISVKLTIVLSFLLCSWYCFFKFGPLLSNGREPSSYTVFTQYAGGAQSSRGATRLDVDPAPFWTFAALIAVTSLCGWMLKIGGEEFMRVVLGPTKQRRALLTIKFQEKQAAAARLERKIYKDSGFKAIDEYQTKRVFG